MLKRIAIALPLIVSLFTGAPGLFASPVTGMNFSNMRVGAFTTVPYRGIYFRGFERATVAVMGDGDTVLSLRVFDQNGILVGEDTCQYRWCVTSFIPRWTQPFYITVENMGGVYNEYAMRAY